MLPQMLFHPHHVVPAAELIAALKKLPHHPVAHPLMKPDAVLRQVRVIPLGPGDAGVQVEDMLLPQNGGKSLVKGSSNPLPLDKPRIPTRRKREGGRGA